MDFYFLLFLMKYIFLVFISISFFLTSCSQKEEVIWWVEEKQDFLIETKLWSELSGKAQIRKTSQVSSGQDILLSSQTNGRINAIMVKKGQNVQLWQPIAYLTDTFGTTVLWAERARNNLERAQINRDQTKLSLEKQLFDTDIQIENLERSLETLKKDTEENIRWLQDNFDKSNLINLDSTSQLQLEQFDINYERQQLDYATKLLSDAQTRQGFIDFLSRDENNLRSFYNSLTEFLDEIFFISKKDRFKDSLYRSFLGAEDQEQKIVSENYLRQLLNLKESSYFPDFRNNYIGKELSDEEIQLAFQELKKWYDLLRVSLPEFEETFSNSIDSIGQLPKAELDQWKNTINSFQWQFQQNFWVYIQNLNQSESFLKTYKNIQVSQKKSLDLQKTERDILLQNLTSSNIWADVWLERTIINFDDKKKNIETQLRQLQNSKENLIESTKVQLRSLDNAVREANIWLKQANLELEKLTITSPISGTIGDVLTDVGQQIQTWTPVVQILSKWTPEIEISLSISEKNMISEGQEVIILRGEDSFVWKIYAISDVADSNLNYNATIIFESDINILWSVVQVLFPIEIETFLLPLRLIETSGQNIGKVTTFSGGTLEKVRVKLWEVYGDQIEIISCAQNCSDLDIVWNDTSNYNSLNFNLKKNIQ